MKQQYPGKAAAISAVVLSMLLVACGGGGGGGDLSGSSSSAVSSSAASSAVSSSVSSSSVASSSAASSSGTSSSAASSASSGTTSVDAALFNVDGYAAVAEVTGGGVLDESSSQYIKVTTAAEFLAALNNIKYSTKTASTVYKVIEIAADLDLGYEEAGGAATTATYSFFTSANAPLMHPTLLTTGVSSIDIKTYNGLIIYSKTGHTIRHAGFNIKAGENLIIRNLTFDELWEWDELTKGDYDKNDWDYITIGDSSSASGRVWIYHCSFYKAYDGIVDVKKGAATGTTQAENGVTISWSAVLPGSSNASFMKDQ